MSTISQFTFSWYIAVGEGTGASADGRRLGEPVSSNFSPSAGAMTNGITGAIRSYCHLDQELLPIGSPIDLGLSERHVAGETGTVRLAGLLKSFLAMQVSAEKMAAELRSVKSPEEIKRIEEAIARTDVVFSRLRDYLRPGLGGMEIFGFIQDQIAA